MRKLNNHQRGVIGFLIALMLGAVACSGQSDPAPQSSPATMDQAELSSMVEDAVKAALVEAMPPPGDEISRQELQEMMGEVLALVPPSSPVSPASPAFNEDAVAELVSKSIAEMLAASPPSYHQGRDGTAGPS